MSDAGQAVRRVVVVDDHRTFGQLLQFALSVEPGLHCVAVATCAVEGVALAVELQPELVVLDIGMPRMDGLTAARRIKQGSPGSAVVVVTAHCEPCWVVRAADAGASAFVPKSGSLPEMLDVLRRVRPDEMLVAAETASRVLLRDLGGDVSQPALTDREHDVLHHLGRGLAPKAVAKTLGISVHTTRGYVKSLLAKLAVSSQLEAVLKAQRLGLLDSGPVRE